MTITYTPRNNKKTICVEGYGTFTVRPYGAGEELQIRANMRELNEIQTISKGILEKYKTKNQNDPITEEDQKELADIQKRVDDLVTETHEILKSTVTSSEEGAVEKLFRELDRTEIRRIIDAALLGKIEDDKETNASA